MPKRSPVASAPLQQISWECSRNHKQTLFLSCPAEEIFFGGQAGGGKTDALIMSGIGPPDNCMFTNPHWKVLCLRRTFPELERSIIFRTLELFHGKARYDGQKHRWTFPLGGIFQFGHIKNDDDVVKYQSAEYNRLLVDELTHFTERMYLYLFSRIRSPHPSIKCKIRTASNPGGLGHGWVKKRFIEEKEPYKFYEERVMIDNQEQVWRKCFIPSGVDDNRYLMDNDPGYKQRLMMLPDIERRALLYGDWDIYKGQFFTEFSEDNISDEFEIPSDWPIWVAMDWGYATKCAVGFFAEDPETGMIYLWQELYLSKVQAETVGSMIMETLGNRRDNVVAMYSDKRITLKGEDGAGISTQERFATSGCFFQLANDDRVAGWHRLRELFLRDREGRVKFKVFRNCANFIRIMPEQIHDEHRPEDLDKKGEAHLADMARYYAIMRKALVVASPIEVFDHMQSNPRTGYIGVGSDEGRLKDRIKRLPGLKRNKNYFLDKVPE